MRESNGEGGVKATYLRGAGLVAQVIDLSLFYYLLNAHGDVVQRIAGNKQVAPRYEYDAFGVQRERVGYDADKDPNPLRYCGEYFDSDVDEYYLRARTYQPRNGRFTSEDPAKDGGNWYSYCGGEPVTRTDPSGLAWYLVDDNYGTKASGPFESWDDAVAAKGKITMRVYSIKWFSDRKPTPGSSSGGGTSGGSTPGLGTGTVTPPPTILPSTEEWSISRFGGPESEDGHDGTDFFTHTYTKYGAYGKHTPVSAEWSGEVVGIQTGISDDAYGRGNYVVVKMDAYYGADRYMILQHLEVVSVEVGQRVDEDTQVGTVGESGAGGVHLHIELREGVVNGNPDSGTVLPLETTLVYGGDPVLDWLQYRNASNYLLD